jgi:hypothetical protein
MLGVWRRLQRRMMMAPAATQKTIFLAGLFFFTTMSISFF